MTARHRRPVADRRCALAMEPTHGRFHNQTCYRCLASEQLRIGHFHAVAEQIIESTLRHDLYSPAKQLFQLGDQSARKPRARLRPDFNQ